MSECYWCGCLDEDHIEDSNLLWLFYIFPIIAISLVATGIFSLLQSALPLDLVAGGIKRLSMPDTLVGLIITIQLYVQK